MVERKKTMARPLAEIVLFGGPPGSLDSRLRGSGIEPYELGGWTRNGDPIAIRSRMSIEQICSIV